MSDFADAVQGVLAVLGAIFLAFLFFAIGLSAGETGVERSWQRKMDAGLIRVMDEKAKDYIWVRKES